MESIRKGIILLTFFTIPILFLPAYCQKTSCDFNKDGIVDNKDRLVLERALGAERNDPDWVEKCDLNQDGYIDFTDLDILIGNLGQRIVEPVDESPGDSTKSEIKGVPVRTAILKRTPLLQIDFRTLEKIESSYFAAEVLIDPDGSFTDMKISKSTGFRPLDIYLSSELKKWKFEPVTKDEKSVKAWIYCRIDLKRIDAKNPLFLSK